MADTRSDTDESVRAPRTTNHGKRIRPQACVGCRTSKIRCIPVPNQSSCQACQRSLRECVMPGPPKPRIRTATRVSELEKKIERLTDALIEKSAPTTPATSITPTSTTQKAKCIPARGQNSNSPFVPPRAPETPALTPDDSNAPRSLDSIDRGLVDLQTSEVLLDFWRKNMFKFMPITMFITADGEAQAISVQELRKSSPMVFLAILVVSSASSQPSLLPKLLFELNMQLAERVLITGEKSLDLVQGILIYTTHFIVPAGARRSSFTQYIHSAISVSLDLGLDKIPRPAGPNEKCVVQRTWLACYYLASNVATLFRHTPIIRGSRVIDQYHQQLASATDSVVDIWLCHLIGLRRMLEEASTVFELEDPASPVSFRDPKCQFQLAAMTRQLKTWREACPSWIGEETLSHILAGSTLYIHTIAIRTFEQNSSAGESDPVSDAAHFEALRICFECSVTMITQYLSFRVEVARCLPDLYLLWTVYATVMLIKLGHFIKIMSDVLGRSENPTASLLDSMINRLAALSIDGHYPQAKEFSVVFERLRVWFLYKRASCQFGDTTCNLVGARPGLGISYEAPKNSPNSERISSPNQTVGPVPAYVAATSVSTSTTMDSNVDWESFGFDANGLSTFDINMQSEGWMSYLYEQQPIFGDDWMPTMESLGQKDSFH
ncbi:hypothetical protein FKW77_000962 [Venturia effusa]|uniref:Zn(2)-C6 fungal-type domain-containing protein n=1 Tax=Venturia effusa TaxID=50376 RepID=A0A517LMC0_9PEZI|nr:hypothetical protein FKW77_000962 [Venturia effusa]